MTSSTIEVTRDGPVGWLVFDRPDRGNAIDATMFTELEAAWAELDADPAVRVIVNTGNGSSFQTGLDVGELASNREALREHSRRTRDFELRMTAWHCQVWKPVVAAVNGVCAGGGLHFVADADIVIAAAGATFLDPHVSVGQVSAIETIGMVRRSPMEPIVRMALVGRHERMSASRAYELGIISEIVDPAEGLRERAQEIGETIARNSPAAMAATKRALWGALEHGLTDACRAGAEELVGMWDHPDHGVRRLT
ncbi:MAG: enoyl-CoA hydratase/isomerase family protein [Acidimicrobiia bacterium]